MGLSAKRTTGNKETAEILRFSAYLTEKFLTDNVISLDEVKIVKDGLESIGSNLLGFLVTLVIGGILGFFSEGFILWILVFPLRKNAGGFHADTKGRCFLISIVVLMLSFALLLYVKIPKIVCLLITTILFLAIFVMAPVGNHNKVLDGLEQKVYKKRTRITLAIEGVLFVSSFILGWETICILIMVGFAIVGISLIAGRIKLI